MHLVI
jgi:hypothetical protein